MYGSTVTATSHVFPTYSEFYFPTPILNLLASYTFLILCVCLLVFIMVGVFCKSFVEWDGK